MINHDVLLFERHMSLNNSVILLSCISFLFFLFLFILIKYILTKYFEKTVQSEYRVEFCTRVVSTIHACVASTSAFIIILVDNELCRQQPQYSSKASIMTLSFVIGYFMYDLLVMLAYKEIREYLMMLHHFIAMFGLYIFTSKGSFYFIMLVRLITEFSTPFVNNRWFMLKFNLKDSNAYLYNGYLMLVSFFLFRILPIIPIWMHSKSLLDRGVLDDIPFVLKSYGVMISVPLDIMNIYWFMKILRACMKFGNKPVNNQNLATIDEKPKN